jgi:uncharacterized protein (TIGR00251 family)
LKISVKVKPNSIKDSVLKLSENNFEVKVRSAPEKGKANNKVIELISKFLNIPKSKINIIRGIKSRIKIIEVTD